MALAPPSTLHITNAYHASSGGIRTFYQALLRAANVAERHLCLVVPGERRGLEEIGRFGRLYTVPAPLAPAFDRRYRLMLPQAYWPGLSRDIVPILERERPDLVEICDKYTLPYLAAMLRKGWHRRVPRPVLVGLSCERFDDNMRAYLSRHRAAAAFTRWYIRHIYGPPFDAHIAVSDYAAAELRAALADRAPDFVSVRGMGVDVDAFGPAHHDANLKLALAHQAGGSASSVLLLYAGRLSPEKHVDALVDMMEGLTRRTEADYRLVVAGDGPSLPALQQRAANLGVADRLLFCGQLERPMLARYYASVDVFVHPNPREPFGIGPLEAMASGVAVVAPRQGGVASYASESNAWTADPTGASLAAAVSAARHGDPERRAAALETAARCGWPCVTDAYFALYDAIHARVSDALRLPALASERPQPVG